MKRKKAGGKKNPRRTEARKQHKERIRTSAHSGIVLGPIKVESFLLLIMYCGLAVLLFIGPFQRGLFFPRELLLAKILLFAILFVWGLYIVIGRRDNSLGIRQMMSPLDLCLMLLTAAYFISFFFAVHKRDAIEELLKIAAYLVVYLTAVTISRYGSGLQLKTKADHPKDENSGDEPSGLALLLHLLLAASTVITIASFGAAAGQWDFLGAYVNSRIASPMGYANAAAAYFMASYLLAVGLAPLAKGMLKALYLAPAALKLVALILTFSRGAWLMLPLLVIIMILLSAKGQKERTILYFLTTSITALPFAIILDPLFRSGNAGQAWLFIAAAAFAAIILGIIVEFYLQQKRKVRLALSGASLAVAAVIVVITIIMPIFTPLQLERSSNRPARQQTIEQVVDSIETDMSYQLSFQINAGEKATSTSEDGHYTWGVRVLGGLPGYRNETLLDYRGGKTVGWEDKVLTFQTKEETTRLEVHFYNEHPGTYFEARSIILSSDNRQQTLHFALHRTLPQRFYERIYSYSRDRNMDRRFELFRDALKVIKDYPIFGIGGGGFASVYQVYQEQPYASREVHNHFLQVWIESGIIGFLSFIGIWVSFAFAFARNCFKKSISFRRRQYWTASFMPVAALGAHSAIDWNFSMAAVGIFLFVLLGAGRSLDQSRYFGQIIAEGGNVVNKSYVWGIAASTAGILLTVYSIILITGLDATWRSQEFLERNNLKQAATEMERAISLDPLKAENYHNLNVLLENQFQFTGASEGDIERLLYLARRAYELEPFNPSYVSRYGNLLFAYVDVIEGLSYSDRLIGLRPFQENSYLQPALARLRIAEFHMQAGNYQEAKRYLDEIIELEGPLIEKYGESQSYAFIVGQAYLILGNHPAAIQYLSQVDDENQFYEAAQGIIAELSDRE